MRALAVVLALGLLVAGCGRYGAPIRQRPAPAAVSALPDRTADVDAEECEDPEQKP
jgi:hypothetical protein